MAVVYGCSIDIMLAPFNIPSAFCNPVPSSNLLEDWPNSSCWGKTLYERNVVISNMVLVGCALSQDHLGMIWWGPKNFWYANFCTLSLTSQWCILFMVHIHRSGFCFSTVVIWIKTTQVAGAARWHDITTWTSFLPLSNMTILEVPENEKYIAYETGANMQLQYDHQLATPTKNKIGGGSSMIVILYYYQISAVFNVYFSIMRNSNSSVVCLKDVISLQETLPRETLDICISHGALWF